MMAMVSVLVGIMWHMHRDNAQTKLILFVGK